VRRRAKKEVEGIAVALDTFHLLVHAPRAQRFPKLWPTAVAEVGSELETRCVPE